MLDFLIAMFGGAYYASKYANEKAQNKKAEEQAIERKDRGLMQRYVATKTKIDHDDERKVQQYVDCGKYYKEIYEELYDDLVFVFEGEDYIYEFLIPGMTGYTKYRKKGENDYAYWAKALLLSHIGKVGSNEWHDGFHIGGFDTAEIDIRMCQRIEENIQRVVPQVQLYFCPPTYAPDEVCGGKLKIGHVDNEETNTSRLW